MSSAPTRICAPGAASSTADAGRSSISLNSRSGFLRRNGFFAAALATFRAAFLAFAGLAVTLGASSTRSGVSACNSAGISISEVNVGISAMLCTASAVSAVAGASPVWGNCSALTFFSKRGRESPICGILPDCSCSTQMFNWSQPSSRA